MRPQAGIDEGIKTSLPMNDTAHNMVLRTSLQGDQFSIDIYNIERVAFFGNQVRLPAHSKILHMTGGYLCRPGSAEAQ